MSKKAHTPGPWGYTSRKGSWDWVVYCNADPNIEICQPFHDGSDLNQVGEANTRLIAAAPDMLEALEEIASLETPNANATVRRMASIARAAIAKTTKN